MDQKDVVTKRLKTHRRELAESLKTACSQPGVSEWGKKWMRDHFRANFRSVNQMLKKMEAK